MNGFGRQEASLELFKEGQELAIEENDIHGAKPIFGSELEYLSNQGGKRVLWWYSNYV